MKRLLISFFLLLFIFLSSGYSQLYAHSLKENESATPKKIFRSSHPGTGEAKFIVDAREVVEEEDDDNNSSRKFLDSCIITFDHFYNASAHSLHFCRPLSSTISHNRNILYQVFRV